VIIIASKIGISIIITISIYNKNGDTVVTYYNHYLNSIHIAIKVGKIIRKSSRGIKNCYCNKTGVQLASF